MDDQLYCTIVKKKFASIIPDGSSDDLSFPLI